MPDAPKNSPLQPLPPSAAGARPLPRVPVWAKNPPPIPLIPALSERGETQVRAVARRPARRRPLPDPRAIRVLAVPELAPAYDDGPPAAAAEGTGLPPSAAPSFALAGPRRESDRPVPPATVGGSWPSQFAQVLAETLSGSRPAKQLTPWTTEQARKRISQLGPTLATARQPRVRRVIVTAPAPDVLEMTVVMDIGPRARAVAVRLERPPPAVGQRSGVRTGRPGQGGAPGWLCTDVEAA